jgi:hypothetical protein
MWATHLKARLSKGRRHLSVPIAALLAKDRHLGGISSLIQIEHGKAKSNQDAHRRIV